MDKKRAGMLKVVLTAAALLGLLGPALVSAATYYVDQNHPAASDGNAGTQDAPWATLRRAMEEALQPGDTVLVKGGTYDASGGQWNTPALNPASSGTADKPITFRSVPQHAARLDTRGDAGAIGSRGRNHIVIDGFELQSSGALGVVVFGTANNKVTGVVIQNMKIHGMRESGGGNADGIRIERASGVIARNNEIFDIDNDQSSTNAAGVKIYYSDNIIVEHNEIYDVVAGVKDKEEGVENHVRRNYFRDCRAGMELMNQNRTTTNGYYFYQNIVENCRAGFVGHTNSTAQMHKVFIYNNLFYGYTQAGVIGTEHGTNRRVWNNIFYRTGDAEWDISARHDPPREFQLIDYNLYYQEPKMVTGLYASNRWFNSLAAWQAAGHGFDANSLVADPLFQNAHGSDFRLAAGSPGIGAGRVGGNGSGRVINVGPYMTGNEVIGRMQAPAGAPQAPTELQVE